MEVVAEIWRRATSVQPVPPATIVALVALAALGLVVLPALWPYTRMLVTITHEGGHAIAALATGRRLRGIRLHSDTSGVTLSSGRPRGPGMVIMLVAGYLAPALVGLGAVVLLLAGYSLGLLWLFVFLLGLMLLQIRNFYGFAVIVGCAVVLVAVSWYASATLQSTLAYLLTWILLIAAPKPVIELLAQRRHRRAPQSDADQLSRLTRLPAIVWAVAFLLMNLVGLAVGAGLLMPALARLASGAAHVLAG
jgi:Peptidase M50B-like